MTSVPRTVEIIWGGQTAPGFTLKRKRTGAILISTVMQETQVATTLKVGSELKLVGGFPVKRLKLQDVKKVMLLAPKPVSLVFINADDVIIGNAMDTDKGIPGALSTVNTSRTFMTVPIGLQPCSDNSGESSNSNKSLPTITSSFYSEPSATNKAKKRKVSKLQVALVRVNQLLNRPVRQTGLHVATGKSIVV
ncbi:unnamed protein product [Peronospora belbahrii]|uniref:Uncharacterized protein n=1 Tax=Peronospora belbahrii TaxID=622444 RepID=A0AAU9L2B4_9STRA|nr:unnamed protein product [Peronospora belbahrii]CAH0520198.1 unnamed protein product [Peronospora belbahrii]